MPAPDTRSDEALSPITALAAEHEPGLTQERLINRGYAICDAALRAWVDSQLAAVVRFPYPATAV